MIQSILIGSGFAFAAAATPGIFQAYLLSSVARKGWKRTLPACFAPLLSDGPIAVLVLLVLNRLPELVTSMLQVAGGVFLVYLAWINFRQWQKPAAQASSQNESVPRTLLQAATVNFLNPAVYIGWSLVLGPAILRAWHTVPANAVALLIAFYVTMVTVTAGIILLFGLTSYLGSRGRRNLVLVSALLLTALGMYQFGSGLLRWMGN